MILCEETHFSLTYSLLRTSGKKYSIFKLNQNFNIWGTFAVLGGGFFDELCFVSLYTKI